MSSIVHNAALIQAEQGKPCRTFPRIFSRSWIDCRPPTRPVHEWVKAIREEEALASGNHNVAELDQWEAAHFRENKVHREVVYRKRLYEDALRREFFGF